MSYAVTSIMTGLLKRVVVCLGKGLGAGEECTVVEQLESTRESFMIANQSCIQMINPWCITTYIFSQMWSRWRVAKRSTSPAWVRLSSLGCGEQQHSTPRVSVQANIVGVQFRVCFFVGLICEWGVATHVFHSCWPSGTLAVRYSHMSIKHNVF